MPGIFVLRSLSNLFTLNFFMRTSLLLFLLPIFLFVSCKKVPDHARYIPKTAVSVVGINTGAMGKKMAWESITGADKMGNLDSLLQQNGMKLKAEDLRHSGIDMSSTLYTFFASNPNPADPYSRMPEAIAVLPLEDAGEWETFLPKAFPQMKSLTAEGGKAAELTDGYIAFWTPKVAFLRNTIKGAGSYKTLPDSTEEWQEGAADMTATLASLTALPKLTKEESIASEERFAKLEKGGHDVTAWLNYERMMSSMSGGMAGMSAMLGGQLYKNTALAAGLDFKDGKAEADMWYYTSESLRDASKKIASQKIPQDMIQRLPKENLDGFAAMGLSMEGMKMMFEKAGMLGLFNMALSAQGLSLDDVMEALTGDVVASVNNFRTVALSPNDPNYNPYRKSDVAMDYVVALKLGKPEKVAKLMQFMTGKQLLTQIAPNVYASMGSTGDNGVLVMDKNYAVAARTTGIAQAYLAGTAAKDLKATAKEAAGNGPMGFFLDFQQIFKGLNPALMTQERDRQMMAETQKMFSHLTMSGGSFSGDCFTYKMTLAMVNEKENALMQLLRYAGRMNQMSKEYPAQYGPVTEEPEAIDTLEATVPL